jgi:hypothetical protein
MINDLYSKIGTILIEWCKNRASKNCDINFRANDSEGNRFIGFSTQVIESILPPLESSEIKWKNGVYILYVIDNKFNLKTRVDTVNISCVINNVGLSPSGKEFCELLITAAGKDIKENWITKKLKTWNVRKCKENEKLETIEDDINSTLNDILENDISNFEKEFFEPRLKK